MLTSLVLAVAAATAAPADPAPPRLVLQVTVDGLREDLVWRCADRFGEGGFRRLLEDGTWYSAAHYAHANTETVVGHSTLATGAHPAVHGMTGNVWFDAAADELSYNIEDPDHLPIPVRDGQQVGDQVDPAQLLARTKGRSPRALLAETVADRLLAFTGGRAKAFAVSSKDRSAVVMGGQGGQAYWFSTDSGDYVTSTFYTDAYPEWVAAWNAERPARALAETEWTLLADIATYALGHQDDRPYEADLRGYGRVFPHRFAPADSPLLFTQVLVSPHGDRLLADFAAAAITHEGIGDDDVTDYLSVSFSGVDAVNHFFGPSSLETEDTVLQLDRTLADFFAFVDESVGADRTVIVLSADHGMPEAAGYMAERKMDADRVDIDGLVATMNESARDRFGLEDIVTHYFRPFAYLDHDAIEAAGLDLDDVRDAVAADLTAARGIHLAATPRQLRDGPTSPLRMRILNNLHPERSGDIYVVQDPYWFHLEEGPIAVMHGSPWQYDTHVPIAFAGPGIPARRVHRAVRVVDVAPTVAALIGMSPPASAQGTVLYEALEGAR